MLTRFEVRPQGTPEHAKSPLLIPELLLSACERHPEKEALIWEQGCMTYIELLRHAVHHAKKLKISGIRTGDRVGLLASNGPEFLVGYFALQLIGALPAPINPNYKISEIKILFPIAKLKAILTEPLMFTQLQEGLGNNAIFPIQLDSEVGKKPVFSITPPSREAHEPGHIRFTSGTEATPRAVVLSHHNLTWRIDTPGTHCREDDVFFCPVAFPFRILKILQAIGMGATIVSLKRFSVKMAVDVLISKKITWMWGTPAIYKNMTDAVSNTSLFKDLRGVSSAGAILFPRVQKEFENKFGLSVYQHYGMSEGMDAAEMPADESPVYGSVGKNCEGVEISIDAKPGETGEILFSGPNVMIGYYGLPAITETRNGHRVIRSGDLGRMDNGYLFIQGRKKDFINVDGIKVHTAEIESIIYDYPGVARVKVRPVHDDTRGEIPAAYVVPQDGEKLSASNIRKYCLERIANSRAPRIIEIVDSLPIDANGKLL